MNEILEVKKCLTISFSRFREQYKTFTYEDYHITKDDKYITVSFDFKIDGLCEFHPKTEIEAGRA